MEVVIVGRCVYELNNLDIKTYLLIRHLKNILPSIDPLMGLLFLRRHKFFEQ